MFGYVRPSLGRLSQEDTARFSAMYCGLCRALGRRCGKAASLILNYDFTFLAVLLAEGEAEIQPAPKNDKENGRPQEPQEGDDR